MINNKISIKSFRDLDVYQNTYKAMLIVMREILPKLPDSERYDLRDQLSRSCKAIPRLIAEGYAKKHQRAGFQKYIDDAMAECNETIVGIEQARDIYHLDNNRCDEIVDIYDKSARQMYNLAKAWDTFKNSRTTTPKNDTGCETEKRITTLQPKGQTLVELLLALGLFAFIMTAVFALVFGGLTTGLRTEEQDYATMYAQEGLDAARSIRDTNWDSFAFTSTPLAIGKTHGVELDTTNGGWKWKIPLDQNTSDETPFGARKFTREITVEDVWRTDSNSDGILDDIFTGGSSADFDFSVSGDYQCEGGTCPSANLIVAGDTAKLNGSVRLDNSVNPKELAADGNTKALYHFNKSEGDELDIGVPGNTTDDDLGGASETNLKGLWHLNEGSGSTVTDSSASSPTNTGTIYNTTRMYLHEATDATSGLPSGEQSTDTANTTWTDANTARQMNQTIGVSQQAPSQATAASTAQKKHFIRMWSSPALAAQTIAAQNWTFNFARLESNLNVNFKSRVNLYVWRPSGSNCGATPAPCTVGTIILPTTNSAADYENTAINTIQSYHWSAVAGSAVTAQDGDRVILEWWGDLTQASASAYTINAYYDGTTATTTSNTTVISHASFLEATNSIALSSAWTTAGKFGNALSFDGVDDFVSAPFLFNPSTTNFSAEAWVKGADKTTVRTIVQQENGGGTGRAWLGANITTGYLYTAIGGVNLVSSINVLDGAWHHVTVVWNGTDRILYADGAEVGRGALAPESVTSGAMRIGSGKGANYFSGSIDEAAVYNTALTPAQITDHYNRGRAKDATVNNNDGKIISPVTTSPSAGTNLNQALQFDGVDDFVSAGNVGAGIKSVEFWINDSNKPDEILELNGTTSISINSSGAITTTAGFTSPTIYVNGNSASATLSAGWNHVVVVDNSAGGINASAVNLGKVVSGYFSGSLDEVAIWNKTLTQQEIWDHIGANLGYTVNTYATVKYNINPSKDTSYIDKFKEFVETATIPAGTSIDYQLSTDNCATMKYWDGDSWENVGGWNDARTINRYFDQLAPASTICLSARLNTTGANQTPVLDNVEIKYTTNRDLAATLDTHTKRVTSRVKWPSGLSFQDMSLTEYLTDWNYGFWTQTDDTTTQTGFKLSGYSNSSTTIFGASTAAKVQLNQVYSGTGGTPPSLSSNCNGGAGGYDGTWPDCTLSANVYNYDSFNIPNGVTVSISDSGDTTIYTTGTITIAGTLQANGGVGYGQNGRNITIQSGGSINITGYVNAYGSNGSNGGDPCGEYEYGCSADDGGNGGNGGNITIIALSEVSTSTVYAYGGSGGNGGGSGGNAEYGGNGGSGGNGGIIIVKDSDGVASGTYNVSNGSGGWGGNGFNVSGSNGSSGSTGTVTKTTPPYFTSGTYTSGVIDIGQVNGITTFGFGSTIPAETQTGCTANTGAGCALKIQIAANNDQSTWNYVGPDGTASTYFTSSGEDIHSSLDGNQYFRYKAYFTTADIIYTPSLDDITITSKTPY